eukprot:TRINITY_DN10610_c0_g1_i1.p1 TRINITY_DN10610_c0_g1~~TRINITY_DN10610_c0_g1_i1.p1  ORF type:complete len:1236 (+),score=302.66 TRINITY_DN10610_c0_g1_i1:108-3710(+)
MVDGGVKGRINYSWDAKAYKIVLDSGFGYSYEELHDYNDERGFDVGNPLQFRDQYVFKSGDACGCMTGVLDHGMPVMWNDSSLYEIVLTSKNLPPFDVANDGYPGNNGCAEYRPNASYRAIGTHVEAAAFAEDGTICWIQFDTGREIFFDQVTFETPPAFVASEDCQCSKPLDICIVVDRSASLNPTEFDDEKRFLLNFADQFDLSGSMVGLSIVSFNADYWDSLDIATGVNSGNVVSSINAMSCCDSPFPEDIPDASQTGICCGGTPHGFTSISEGIKGCTDQLASAPNRQATQIMIVVTDGYHNTKLHSPDAYDVDTDFCFPDCLGQGQTIVEGSEEWEACTTASQRSACRADLYNAAQIPKNAGVVMYAIGVGDAVSDEDLETIASTPNNIIKRDTFAELAANNLEIVSRACDANDQPCGEGCCGFCSCGQCLKSQYCDDGVYCTIDGVPDGELCCDTIGTPACDQGTDKCVIFDCFEEACNERPVQCSGGLGNCYNYQCNPEDGECISVRKNEDTSDLCHTWSCDESVNGGRVTQVDNCPTSGDNCFTYGCDASSGDCTVTPRVNPNVDPDTGVSDDQCLIWDCDGTKSGNNVWVSSPRNCEHPASAGVCKVTGCDSDRGCETVDRVCRGTLNGKTASADNLCDLTTCDPNADSGDLACVEKWVTCPEYEGNDQCSVLKTSGRDIIGNSHPGRGCNVKTGLCEYTPKVCTPTGCERMECDSNTGACNAIATPSCGEGLCTQLDFSNGDPCNSDKCIRRSCDPDSSTPPVAGACELEEVIIDCTEDGRNKDNCLVLDFTFFSPADVNQINPGCDPSVPEGEDVCRWIDVPCVADWEASEPSDKCKMRVLDSSASDCCIEIDVPRESESLCTIGSCDPATGIWTEVPKCGVSDACMDRSCDNGECTETPLACVSDDPCVVAESCDPLNGGCVFVPYVCEDDGNQCTKEQCVNNNGVAECIAPTVDCNDGNPCSEDSCDPNTGTCTYTETVCNDNNECTIDTCDASTVDGCVYTEIDVAEVCDDHDMCTIDTCDPAVPGGCVWTVEPCTDGDPCTYDICTPFRGCEYRTVDCPMFDDCRVGFCDISRIPDDVAPEDWQQPEFSDETLESGETPPHPLCGIRNLECYSGLSTEVTIAATLGTAAVVGIIVGIVLCLALGGGGIWAVYQRGGISSVNTTMNNPLYAGAGNNGENPLYKQQQ